MGKTSLILSLSALASCHGDCYSSLLVILTVAVFGAVCSALEMLS